MKPPSFLKERPVISGSVMKAVIILLGYVWALFCAVEGSHFRGGTISWTYIKENANNSHEILVSYRLGWRRSFISSRCDDDTIANRTPGYNMGSWSVASVSQRWLLQSTEIICTVFDPVDDWVYGYNDFTVAVPTSTNFSITFASCCWIGGLATGYRSSWAIGIPSVDLRTRSDTGRPNSSPITFSPPLVRLQLGCPSSIVITSTDQDGDNVKCRYAVGTECSGACGQYPHFTLDEENCIIHYNGGGTANLVPIAIMLEDHPTQVVTLDGNTTISPTNHFSAIPLQFLVKIMNVGTGNLSCNTRPSYPPFAIPDGTTVAVSDSSSTFDKTLYAYPSEPSIRIDRFIIIGPLGMQHSPVFYLGADLYATNVTWAPDNDQKGDHSMCYYAVDANGKNSNQRCLTIAVTGISGPCDVENGGCSDECLPVGTSNICSCSHPCWVLAGDDRTCVPKLNITCSGESVDITVAACATDKTIVAGTERDYFSHASCQSQIGPNNHRLNFPITECGTDIELSAQGVQFGISIWTWEGVYEGSGQGSVITRGEWQNIKLACTLPASSNLTASFLPVAPVNTEYLPREVPIQGIGSFTLFFEIYRTSSFLSAYGPFDYPIEVTLDQQVYFKLGAAGRGGLVLLTEQCVAMSTPTLTQTSLTYFLIRDGCMLDSTMRNYSSSNPMENLFSITAFQFQDNLLRSRNDSDIYIQCQILLCDASTNTRCSQGCVPSSSRRKRQIEDIEYEEDDDEDEEDLPPDVPESPPQTLTNFIVLILPGQDVDDIADETPPPTVEFDDVEVDDSNADKTTLILGIITGVAVAITVVFLAYYFLVVKRKGERSDTSVKI